MKRPKMVSLDDETYAWASTKDNFSGWVRAQIRRQIDNQRRYAGECPGCHTYNEWRAWPKYNCRECGTTYFGERLS
jgi:hypothetical protein